MTGNESYDIACNALIRVFPSLSVERVFTPLLVALFTGLNSMILASPENLDLGVDVAVAVSELVQNSTHVVLTPWRAFSRSASDFAPKDTNFLILRDFSRFDYDSIDELKALLTAIDDDARVHRRPHVTATALPELLGITGVVDMSHEDRSVLKPVAELFSVGIII